MASTTIALLWGIWRKQRWTIAAIGGVTAAGHLAELIDQRLGTPDANGSALVTLLAIVAFVLLLAVFNVTESSHRRGLGDFPRRLFALPVTSLRLVAVPMLAGIVSIELLYLLWMAPLSRGAVSSVPFVLVLLATLVTLYMSAMWTLERAGTLRLVVLGVIAIGLFVVQQLPQMPPTPAPAWRSEHTLGVVMTAVSMIAFLVAWRYVDRMRHGGGQDLNRSGLGRIAEALPVRRTGFTTPAAAQFWYEWRTSGMVLPALVGGVLLVQVLPMSWIARGDAESSFRMFVAALIAPVALAIPVGIAFSRPAFWSDDLALPSFIAVHPQSSEDFVVIKMKVAALSTLLSWSILLVFLAVWLSAWGNVDGLGRVGLMLWAFHGQSAAAVYGIALLVVVAGMFATFMFMVSRLWTGLSGLRVALVFSIVSYVTYVIVTVMAFEGEWMAWVRDNQWRLMRLTWFAAGLVVVKYWLAARSWRSVSPGFARAYLPIWGAGTAAFLAFGLVVWNVTRIYIPFDAGRGRSLIILMALLAMPLAGIGTATTALARNRHRP